MPRILGVSDIHTDYKENLAWVEHLASLEDYKEDTVILAGDCSDDPDVLRKTLTAFTSAFRHVFFTPGNHELWVRRQERGKYDSLGKLKLIQDLCTELGVKTQPEKIDDAIWIVPLYSWYHAGFDKEPDIPGALPIEKVMLDFHVCDWSSQPVLAAASSSDDSLALYFDKLNDNSSGSSGLNFSEVLEEITLERKLAAQHKHKNPVCVSFSHFLPSQSLLPSKQWLHYPNLAKACGSDYLGARVDALKPTVHVFGHTHISTDTLINGTRYVQHPLGYPHERRRQRRGAAALSTADDDAMHYSWMPIELARYTSCSSSQNGGGGDKKRQSCQQESIGINDDIDGKNVSSKVELVAAAQGSG